MRKQPNQLPKTIEQLMEVSKAPATKLPWELVMSDLKKVAAAKAAGKPIPSQKILSEFFFQKTGTRFGRTAIANQLEKLVDQLLIQNGECNASRPISKRRRDVDADKR